MTAIDPRNISISDVPVAFPSHAEKEESEFVRLCKMSDPKHRLDFESDVVMRADTLGLDLINCIEYMQKSGTLERVSNILRSAVDEMYHIQRTLQEVRS